MKSVLDVAVAVAVAAEVVVEVEAAVVHGDV
jgi:hypothetical protein